MQQILQSLCLVAVDLKTSDIMSNPTLCSSSSKCKCNVCSCARVRILNSSILSQVPHRELSCRHNCRGCHFPGNMMQQQQGPNNTVRRVPSLAWSNSAQAQQAMGSPVQPPVQDPTTPAPSAAIFTPSRLYIRLILPVCPRRLQYHRTLQ